MPNQRLGPVTLEDTRMLFRNFSGTAGQFNADGDRNFNVALDDTLAQQMLADGWNIKWLQPREDGDEPQAILKVKLNFSGRPPRIVLVTSRGKTQLDAATVALLDWAEVIKTDLIVRPYEWTVGDRSGVTAYVQSLFVTIREDELEKKYADVPDSAQSALIPESLEE